MLAVCLLLAGAAVFEHFTIRSTFSGVLEELAALTEKTEEGRANYEDARAVQRSWEAKKRAAAGTAAAQRRDAHG